jgi:hypothetical protein
MELDSIKVLPVNRHGNRSASYKSILRPMTEDDWAVLEQACVQAVLDGHTTVVLALPYTARLPDDWPQGRVQKSDGHVDFIAYNASRVLKWMLKHGYTEITMEQLRRQQIAFTLKAANIGSEVDQMIRETDLQIEQGENE